MGKIILKINNKEDILYPSCGYILGVKDFCICFGISYTVDEIIDIKKKQGNKRLFASLNRPIFNSELELYKSTLQKLDSVGLDGIIVGDVAALTYNLKTPIILDQLHLNNSLLSVKHYHDNKAGGIVLTNDITLDESNKIKENNKDMLIFKQVFGLPHLSTSVRKLVSNYFIHFNKYSSDSTFRIKEDKESNEYVILEDYFGTHILSSKSLNLINEIHLINADYLVFDGYLLNNYKWVLEAFIENNVSEKEKIDNTFNSNEGFINQRTIYKVKNND